MTKVDLLAGFWNCPRWELTREYYHWRQRRRLEPSSRFRRMVAWWEAWVEHAPHMMPGM